MEFLYDPENEKDMDSFYYSYLHYEKNRMYPHIPTIQKVQRWLQGSFSVEELIHFFTVYQLKIFLDKLLPTRIAFKKAKQLQRLLNYVVDWNEKTIV